MPSTEVSSSPRITLRERAHNFVFSLADKCAVAPSYLDFSSVRRDYISLRGSEIVEAVYRPSESLVGEIPQQENPNLQVI